LSNRKIPDSTDPLTVLNFARMCLDSYYEPDSSSWIPVPGWNVTARFGWDGRVGLKGYLFQEEKSEVLVIVIKGTSLATPVSGGETSVMDRFNVSI
jgi:putative lipase involved disintegration of autophagic bodies